MTDNMNRDNVKTGLRVKVVLKQHQRTGELTEGRVARILTNSRVHPRGIKVMLDNGLVGRIVEILGM